MSRPILVTGSTGNVGREVVRALVARGVPVRAAMFRAGADRGAGVPTVALDYADRASYGPAVEGARGLFLLRPPSISNVKDTLNVLIDVAREEPRRRPTARTSGPTIASTCRRGAARPRSSTCATSPRWPRRRSSGPTSTAAARTT